MAAVAPSGSPPPDLFPQDSTPFEQHILSLLSIISQQPSPSYPFPASDSSPPITADVKLESFNGQKTDAQHAIESAIINLGDRIRASPNITQPNQNRPGSLVMTPEFLLLATARNLSGPPFPHRLTRQGISRRRVCLRAGQPVRAIGRVECRRRRSLNSCGLRSRILPESVK
jgi:hypothetical protein